MSSKADLFWKHISPGLLQPMEQAELVLLRHVSEDAEWILGRLLFLLGLLLRCIHLDHHRRLGPRHLVGV